MLTEDQANPYKAEVIQGEKDVQKSYVVPIKSEFIACRPTKPESVKNNKGALEDQVNTALSDFEVQERNLPYKKRKKGQNKNRKNARVKDDYQLCGTIARGLECSYGIDCKFGHDLDIFLQGKKEDLGDRCIQFELKGNCPYGYKCCFLKAHLDPKTGKLITNSDKSFLYKNTKNEIESNIKLALKKGNYNFRKSDIINEGLEIFREKSEFDWEDYVESCIKPREKKKLNFRHKTYLAPLTTVGNLPFRRICKGFGVDITISEMAMCTNLLQGQNTEWALIKRHPSENIFGVQVAGNKPDCMVKCAQLFNDLIDCDFVDINAGCPIDAVYKNGSGSALMGSPGKLVRIVTGMSTILNYPLTVKIRTGIFDNKNVAHRLIPRLQNAGASVITLHGRSRQQRYTKLSDWGYIRECATITNKTTSFFGNGDILSYTDYYERLQCNSVDGVMIGRGALIKPWIFEEIRENKHKDISSKERFEILKKFCDFGLEHWGSDTQGVNHTRRFLLEWQSFLCRYVPVGLLEVLPQKINHRPPPFVGRDDLETLMGSSNADDWVKLSEMLLGPTPNSFNFTPKHVSNSYNVEG